MTAPSRISRLNGPLLSEGLSAQKNSLCHAIGSEEVSSLGCSIEYFVHRGVASLRAVECSRGGLPPRLCVMR